MLKKWLAYALSLSLVFQTLAGYSLLAAETSDFNLGGTDVLLKEGTDVTYMFEINNVTESLYGIQFTVNPGDYHNLKSIIGPGGLSVSGAGAQAYAYTTEQALVVNTLGDGTAVVAYTALNDEVLSLPLVFAITMVTTGGELAISESNIAIENILAINPDNNLVDLESYTKSLTTDYAVMSQDFTYLIEDFNEVAAGLASLEVVDVEALEDVSDLSLMMTEIVNKAGSYLLELDLTMTQEEVTSYTNKIRDMLTQVDELLALVEDLMLDPVTVGDGAAIGKAIALYDTFTQGQKDTFGQAAMTNLYDLQTAHNDLLLQIGLFEGKVIEFKDPSLVTITDEAEVLELRIGYEALSQEQIDLVTEGVITRFVAIEKALSDKKLQVSNFQDEVELAVTPAELMLQDEEAVASLRKSYEALDPAQKQAVGPALEKLLALEAGLESLRNEMADFVAGVVGFRAPENVTLGDMEAIMTLRASYDVMTEEQKGLIETSVYDKLLALEAAIDALIQSAQEVNTTLSNLPQVEVITIGDTENVTEARQAFNNLTDLQKVYIDSSNITKLVALEVNINLLDQSKAKLNAMRNIMDTLFTGHSVGSQVGQVSQEDKTSFETAKNLINNQVSVINTLTLSDMALLITNGQEAIDAFEDAIITEEDVKRAELEESIVEAENLLEGTLVQDPAQDLYAGKILPKDRDLLVTGLHQASLILADTSSTLSNLYNAIMSLKEAIADFKDHILTQEDVAGGVLQAAILDAKDIFSRATFGTEEGNYPLASKYALLDAINLAENSLALSQDVTTLSEATETLLLEMDAFVSSMITLKDLMEAALDSQYDAQNKVLLNEASIERLTEIESILSQAILDSAYSEQEPFLAALKTATQDAITIYNTPTKILIYSESSLSYIQAGTDVTVKSTVFNSIGKQLPLEKVSFISSDETIAVFSDETPGLLVSLDEGKVVITATSDTKPQVSMTKVVEYFLLPEMIVSNIPQGTEFNKDVKVSAYREGTDEVIMIHSGSTIGSEVLASSPSVVEYTFTQEGDYEILVDSGSQPNYNEKVLTFSIDKTKPIILIPAIEDVVDTTVTIPEVTVTDNDAIKSSIISLEKQVNGSYVYLKNVSKDDVISAAGTYRLVVTARDMAGNAARSEEIFRITRDMTSPVISLGGFSAVNTKAVSPEVTLSGGTNQANYTFEIVVTKPDGTIYKADRDGMTFEASGAYTLSVVAKNPNVPALTSTKTASFAIDLYDPTIQVLGVVDNGLYRADVAPVLVISDQDGLLSGAELMSRTLVTLKRNNVNMTFVNGGILSKDGLYTLELVTSDLAGKQATEKLTFTIDKTPPTLSITGGQDGSTYADDVVLTFATNGSLTVSDVNDSTVYPLTGNTLTLPSGQEEVRVYSIKAAAKDEAGNETIKYITLTIDTLPVDFIIDGVVEGGIYSAMPTITATADGQVVNAPIISLGNGAYKSTISYTKPSGETYEKVIHFIVDSTKPSLNLVSAKKNGTQIDLATAKPFKKGDKLEVTLTASDPESGLVSLLGQVGHIANSLPLIHVSDNTYTLSYVFGDGNYKNLNIQAIVENTAKLKEVLNIGYVTLDNMAPTASITLTPNNLPTGLNGVFVSETKVMLTSGEAGAMLKVAHNLSDNPSEVTYSGPITLKEGLNVITYYAIDQAGNKSVVRQKTVEVDTMKPVAPTITNNPSGLTKESTVDIIGSVTAEGGKTTSVLLMKNGQIIDQTMVMDQDDFAFVGVSLEEGLNTLKLVAKDLAGNMSTETTLNVTVDTTAPTFTVLKDGLTYQVSSSEPITGSLSATFNGTSLTPVSGILGGSTFTYTVDEALRQEGKNDFVILGADAAGNLGQGSMATNYLPPALEQKDVEVGGETSLDIPAGTFNEITLLTVQTVEAVGTEDYKPLGSPILYEFTSEPSEAIVIKTYVGVNLLGVGIVHITDDGTAEEFMPAIVGTIDMDNLSALTEDVPYYDPITGILVIRTKNFSTYQQVQDITKPDMTITTLDFTISNGESSLIAGSVSDQDPNAAIKSIVIDGVSREVNLTGTFTYDLALTDGNHTVILTARDTAGNTRTITKTYVVDKTLPGLTLAGPSTSNLDEVTLTVTVTEPVTLTLDGQVIGSVIDTETVILSLEDGNNTFNVSVKDAVGNITNKTYTVTKVASMALTMASPLETDEATINLTGSINVDGHIYVDDILVLSNVAAGTFTITNLALDLGTKIFEVKAVDTAGNDSVKFITVTRKDKVVNPGPGDSGNNPGGNPGGGLPGGFIPVPIPDDGYTLFADEKPIPAGNAFVRFGDTNVTMFVPKGIFAGTGNIQVEVLNPTQLKKDGKIVTDQTNGEDVMKLVGNIYSFEADSKFEGKITVRIPVSVPDGFTDYHKLGVYQYVEETGKWEYVGGRYRKGLGVVEVELEHFSYYGLMTLDKSFDDIDASWAKDYIEYLASMHIVNGKVGDSFKPNDTITRAEFAKLMASVAELDVSDTSVAFKDIKSTDWYTGYINAVYKAGIAGGYEDKTFRPNQKISRQEMVVMLMNLYDYLMNANYKATYHAEDLSFEDRESIAKWASQAVAAATKLNLVSGKGGNQFDPTNNATRAEAAKLIKVLLDAVE